jgi:hypothetical protein
VSCRPDNPPPSEPRISGRAALTIWASNATTKQPSIGTPKTARWTGPDSGILGAAVAVACRRVRGVGTSVSERGRDLLTEPVRVSALEDLVIRVLAEPGSSPGWVLASGSWITAEMSRASWPAAGRGQERGSVRGEEVPQHRPDVETWLGEAGLPA